MADKTKVIKIESILGGQSPAAYFGRNDQFRASLGINPALPFDTDSGTSTLGSIASGFLVNASCTTIFTVTDNLQGSPFWMVNNPKDAFTYVYDSTGSTFTVDKLVQTQVALSDGGTMSSASGNGAAYYDNYIYFAKNTDIARYGPLNGAAAFVGTYWTGTLGKTALGNVVYPASGNVTLPNHVMHRHSDGKLYIADVTGNQGVIHYIATKKTTVEGDTDDGSTYNKLIFGYGLWPIVLESYGSDLAIGIIESDVTLAADTLLNYRKRTRAKIAFWDTTSQNYNKITWVEFPDAYITAMKNINGVLYVFSTSGTGTGAGFRITRFVGGYTFEEIGYFENGSAPLQGAVDGTSARLLFGTYVVTPETAGTVFSLGLQKKSLSTGLFSVGRTSSNSQVTSIALVRSNGGFYNDSPIAGFGNTINEFIAGTYLSASVFWSQIYKIGQPFRITKIRIPLADKLSSGSAASKSIVPKIYTDDGKGTTYTLTTINNTNFVGQKSVVFRPESLTGDHNFWLELRWDGATLCTVALPITIEFELLDD